jgi:hypothetical protein
MQVGLATTHIFQICTAVPELTRIGTKVGIHHRLDTLFVTPNAFSLLFDL